MPTELSASSRPTNSSSMRTRFDAIFCSDRSLPVPRRSFFSTAADTHSASTITKPAVTRPSTKRRKVIGWSPMVQLMPSIASSISGSTPVTQSTAANQTAHEKLRSMVRISRESGKLARSTCTVNRTSTSETSTGMASLNTAGLAKPESSNRADAASTSSSTGNSTPSYSRRPNQIDPSSVPAPLNARVISQATTPNSASTQASSNAPGCCSETSSPSISSGLMGTIMVVQPAVGSSRVRTCLFRGFGWVRLGYRRHDEQCTLRKTHPSGRSD